MTHKSKLIKASLVSLVALSLGACATPDKGQAAKSACGCNSCQGKCHEGGMNGCGAKNGCGGKEASCSMNKTEATPAPAAVAAPAAQVEEKKTEAKKN